MVLNALCQSPVSQGMTPPEAVANTVELAKTCDTLGYHRFWVAEHHSDEALASGAPEVLVAHLATVTERIRVGAGGMLLPYHSPFHIAEQYNLLATLFPERIDLGMGRGGGSERHAPQALGVRSPGPQAFDAMDQLLAYLGPGSSRRDYPDTFASPVPERAADPWVLGTSVSSARFAADRGLPYAFGGFLDPRGLSACLSTYHQHFRPGVVDRPRVNIAWYVQAAETEAEANHLTRTSEHYLVQSLLRGQNGPFQDPDTLDPSAYGPMEQMALAMYRQYALVGTAEQVVEGLRSLQQQTLADELTLVTIPFDHQARLRSYAMIAEAA